MRHSILIDARDPVNFDRPAKDFRPHLRDAAANGPWRI